MNPDFSSPTPLPAKKPSSLPYVFAVLFGVVLISLGVFTAFALTSSPSPNYNSSTVYLVADDASFNETKSFDELNSSSSETENAAIDVPSNYGIDNSATYRTYTSVNSDESLFAEFSLGSIALVRETLSDYFSFAYPAFSSVKFTDSYFIPDSHLALVSDSGKSFRVTLSVEKNSETSLYTLKSLELLSENGQSLFSYDGKFFDFSAYDSDDKEFLTGTSDFEDVFNESSEDDALSF